MKHAWDLKRLLSKTIGGLWQEANAGNVDPKTIASAKAEGKGDYHEDRDLDCGRLTRATAVPNPAH